MFMCPRTKSLTIESDGFEFCLRDNCRPKADSSWRENSLNLLVCLSLLHVGMYHIPHDLGYYIFSG